MTLRQAPAIPYSLIPYSLIPWLGIPWCAAQQLLGGFRGNSLFCPERGSGMSAWPTVATDMGTDLTWHVSVCERTWNFFAPGHRFAIVWMCLARFFTINSKCVSWDENWFSGVKLQNPALSDVHVWGALTLPIWMSSWFFASFGIWCDEFQFFSYLDLWYVR